MFKSTIVVWRHAQIAPVLLVAALAWWLVSTAHAQDKTGQAVSVSESGVDASIRPGDNFFAYANGAWLRATELSAGIERWTGRDEINELTRRQVLNMLDDAVAAPAESTARKVANFRTAYLYFISAKLARQDERDRNAKISCQR